MKSLLIAKSYSGFSQRIGDTTMELKTLLKELLHDEDMRRPEMKRSKSFVSEIVAMVDRQHEAFLKTTGPLGLSSLKQVFQQDNTFWNPCAELWGQGPGFRSKIAQRIEQWFRRHPKVTERLDERLQDAWRETFVSWLLSYTIKA